MWLYAEEHVATDHLRVNLQPLSGKGWGDGHNDVGNMYISLPIDQETVSHNEIGRKNEVQIRTVLSLTLISNK